ncbi:MAG: hypothetical protein ACFNZS_07290 [Ottowia sp.]
MLRRHDGNGTGISLQIRRHAGARDGDFRQVRDFFFVFFLRPLRLLRSSLAQQKKNAAGQGGKTPERRMERTHQKSTNEKTAP